MAACLIFAFSAIGSHFTKCGETYCCSSTTASRWRCLSSRPQRTGFNWKWWTRSNENKARLRGWGEEDGGLGGVGMRYRTHITQPLGAHSTTRRRPRAVGRTAA